MIIEAQIFKQFIYQQIKPYNYKHTKITNKQNQDKAYSFKTFYNNYTFSGF